MKPEGKMRGRPLKTAALVGTCLLVFSAVSVAQGRLATELILKIYAANAK